MQQEIKTINLGAVNCYLVKTGKGFILIDTGGRTVFDKNLSAIRSNLKKELENSGCKPGNLKLIIITHGDPDHTGNCVYLKEKYKTLIAIHKNDSRMVEKGEMPERKVNSLIFRIIMKLMSLTKSRLKKMNSQFERFKPDLFVDENFDLSKYGFDAEIFHLPGHTKGSIGILTKKCDLICGDIFNGMKKPSVTPIVENSKDLQASIERLKRLKIKIVYPGHGYSFLWDQFLKFNKDKLDRIKKKTKVSS